MVKRDSLLPGAIILALLLGTWMLFPGEAGSGSPFRGEGDLDGDGRIEEYILEDHCLTVREGERCIWQSQKEWSCDSFALGDVDNDGTANLVISLWKTGNFGVIRPFWQTGEDTAYKNHLFVYKLEDKVFRPVWCSSGLDRPIDSFVICDTDGDGLNELVVSEGVYRKMSKEGYALDTNVPFRTAIWQWEEWGFSRQ